MTQQYEVEQKFPITDRKAIQADLADLEIHWEEPVEQVDRYFNHPERDFAVTDEALRIRTVGVQNRLTYKGPKIDLATKTRREIELPLGSGQETAEQLSEVLRLLGFRPVAAVHKRRRSGTLRWQGDAAEICWDEVEGVGTFLEIELLADEENLEQVQQRLLALGQRLGLTTVERRSYLELVLGE